MRTNTKKWIATKHEYLPGLGAIQEEGEGMTIAICLEAENAPLLSAAPELLEALKAVVFSLRSPDALNDITIANAEKAIAKATQTL